MAPFCATTRSAPERPRALAVAPGQRVGGSLRAAAEDGFTLIELMIAIVVMTVGVLALGTVLASSRTESNNAENQQAEVHRAQKEIERVASLSYQQVADQAAPGSGSANPNDPLYYYNPGAGTYQWDQGSTGPKSDLLVVDATNGGLSANATPWSDGRLGGNVQDFVTWVTDPNCGPGCPASQDYKRVTVAVTNNTGGYPRQPVLISTIVADPHANPAGTVLNGSSNPLSNPQIQCQNAQGQTVTCTTSVGSATVNKWYLTDSPASGGYSAPTAGHPTHATIAPSGTCTPVVTTGCPVPDLLGTSPPGGTTLFDYSNEQTGVTYVGGRVVHRDAPCAGTPSSTDNTKGEMWVSAPLGATTNFTGEGGMTLNSQTLSGASAAVTLCLAVYDVPASIANLISAPPTRLGVVSYTLAQWPTASTPLSFTFNFSSGSSVPVAGGDRVGVRIWPDPSSGADIAAQYDNPGYASVIQLNSL
jgi:prepilin-type N-terminal cleavage/methylation domain-containing protein